MQKELTTMLNMMHTDAFTTGLETISRKLGSVIEMYFGDVGYEAFNHIIYKLDRKKYNDNRYPTPDENSFDLLYNTDYWIIYKTKKDFIHVQNIVRYDENNNARIISGLRVTIYGANRKYIRKKIYEKIAENKPIDGKLHVNMIGTKDFDITTTSFNRVVLEKDVQRRLITQLYQWYKDKDWYLKHNLVHKLGILLYGEPGTGKSTLIRAIATMFNRANIIMMTPDDLRDYSWWLRNNYDNTKGVFILVLEDIDLLLKKRGNTQNTILTDSYNPDKDQSYIFQLLDGILSMEDTIIIATTNHVEELDPALVRHGRFDIQIEMTKFDEYRATQFVSLFGYNKHILDYIMKKDEYPIAPATLQAKILEYRSKEKTEEMRND